MDIRSPAPSTAAPALNVERAAPQVAKAKPAEQAAKADAVNAGSPADDAARLDDAVSSINTVLNVRAQSLEFKVDEESKRTVVTVIDKDTQEVIRQMPSREALEIAKALDQLQSLLKKQSA